jgi:hypothetical protein
MSMPDSWTRKTTFNIALSTEYIIEYGMNPRFFSSSLRLELVVVFQISRFQYMEAYMAKLCKMGKESFSVSGLWESTNE